MLYNKTAKNCNNIFLIFLSISLIISLIMFYMPISYSQTDSDQFVRDNTTNENFGNTNGDGVVDELDEETTATPTDTTTTDASSADEIQMDTNGDGVVDELDEETTATDTATTEADTAARVWEKMNAPEEICGDHIDNDGDHQWDDLDPEGCVWKKGGIPIGEICGDDIDNDLDGQKDDLDPEGCMPSYIKDDICGDDIDNDSDGQKDDLDPEGCIPPVYEEYMDCDCKATGLSTLLNDLNDLRENEQRISTLLNRLDVSWELKRDAKAILSQDPRKYPHFLCYYLSDEQKFVFYWLNINKDKIIEVAKKRGIDPVAIAGAIAWEALENVKDSSPGEIVNRWAGPGKVHWKNFWWQIDATTTAEDTENFGYLPTKTEEERRKILSTVSGSIEYIGAIMKANADAIAVGGYNINYDPPLLTLFYNAWDLEDIIELGQSKKYPAKLSIEGNPMANWVKKSIEYLKTALEPLDVCPAQ
ncbi:MAG: hypothetical protein K0S93_244 [Nitrososphaeraceae archaeon]|nr:hypothetical protein [Nitrososphaeraceae archaeon]